MWVSQAIQKAELSGSVERFALACEGEVWFIVNGDERIALDELMLRGLVASHEAQIAKHAVRVLAWVARMDALEREGF